MHDANKIANRLLELAFNNGHYLTPMAVLKLVYIAHGWMLGINDKPLIENEIQAWQYGPVIPDLYQDIKEYRNNDINGRLAEKNANISLNKDERDIISFTYDVYGKKTGAQLSAMTHKAGTPWDLTYTPGVFGSKILNSTIKDHYKELYEKDYA